MNGYQDLAADRRAKRFNVVQIVACLYADMPAFDPRGANAGEKLPAFDLKADAQGRAVASPPNNEHDWAWVVEPR